jgi:hypothetical protein
MSTKIEELSMELLMYHFETLNIDSPLGPSFDREKNLHVLLFCCKLFQKECLLFTWVVRACLLIDYSNTIYVFLQFCYFSLFLMS